MGCIDTSKYLNCGKLKVAKETSAKPALQKWGRMGGACPRPDAPKAAFAVRTNALYISYFSDKVLIHFTMHRMNNIK
jgi:hypothetical protein